MQKYLIIFVSLYLTACSSLEFPGVYKITVDQGNVIKQDMVDQLKPGMSKDQVEYIMGSALVKDSFRSDRWDYIYSIQKGDKPRKQHRLTIFFENDKLKYFTGDFTPTDATAAPKVSTAPEATPAVDSSARSRSGDRNR